ncbi:hypothetical protein [Enterovibrio norvegicus]|uniref:Uncharacterized protein n=1 Tax=Enterovibrio norvegicus TaxID=188144 RepID=A0ABV4L7M6_9GAMM
MSYAKEYLSRASMSRPLRTDCSVCHQIPLYFTKAALPASNWGCFVNQNNHFHRLQHILNSERSTLSMFLLLALSNMSAKEKKLFLDDAEQVVSDHKALSTSGSTCPRRRQIADHSIDNTNIDV